jgi:hypothetical protein
VDLCDDRYVFARAGSINYIITRENVLYVNTLGILNPKSKVLFVAKECASVTFVVKPKAVGVITIGKECPQSARTRAVGVDWELGRPDTNGVHAVSTF